MNRPLLLVGAGCTAVAALTLGACGSSTSASTTTSAPAAPATTMPATTVPPTTVPPTTVPATTTPTTGATDPPCTATALQAALPAGTTVVTSDLGFKCEGGYAGAEVNIASTGSGGPSGGITSDTLFQARSGAWVEIGRSSANCAAVPASVYVYCTVS